MKIFLVLSLAIAAVTSTALKPNANPKHEKSAKIVPLLKSEFRPTGYESKIVNGEEAEQGAWPWAVSLQYYGRFFCGGSLISEEYAMTAAHCAEAADDIQVHIGGHTLDAGEEGKIVARSSKIIIHPDWSRNTVENDIGLIKLDRKINFTKTIQPVRLPSRSDASVDLSGEKATAIGWGQTERGSISDVLRQVSVPVITNEECDDAYGGGGQIGKDSHLCTDSSGGKGVCFGDSGGSLNWQRPDGKYVQIGINSFVSAQGCESGVPHGYGRVTVFLDFIAKTTGIKIEE